MKAKLGSPLLSISGALVLTLAVGCTAPGGQPTGSDVERRTDSLPDIAVYHHDDHLDSIGEEFTGAIATSSGCLRLLEDGEPSSDVVPVFPEAYIQSENDTYIFSASTGELRLDDGETIDLGVVHRQRDSLQDVEIPDSCSGNSFVVVSP